MTFLLIAEEAHFDMRQMHRTKRRETECLNHLASQLTEIFELTDLLGIPRIAVPGYEADDIMGNSRPERACRRYGASAHRLF